MSQEGYTNTKHTIGNVYNAHCFDCLSNASSSQLKSTSRRRARQLTLQHRRDIMKVNAKQCVSTEHSSNKNKIVKMEGNANCSEKAPC